MAAFKFFTNLTPKSLKIRVKNKQRSKPVVVLEKQQPQLQLPPGRSIFDVFPNEIIIAIAEHMPVRDRDSFSRCSSLCYKLSFTLRRSLVLTPESIEKFQDGGVCQHLRGLIQSIRFGEFWGKDIRQMPRANDIDETFRDVEIDFDSIVTIIRLSTTALSLFPNAQELYISYMAPHNCEFNIYTAILRGMIGLPICNSLQRLEFQITRERNVRKLTNYWCATDWVSLEDPSYNDFYSKLSPENQGFLGKEQTNFTINKAMNEIVPKLPALTEARIVGHNLPTPTEQFGDSRFEKTAFYYLPLAFAPKLDKLRVETERCQGQGYEGKGWFDHQLLGDTLSRVTDLRIISSHLEKEDIKNLARRFPHLRHLDFQTIERLPLFLTTEDYAPVGKLKDLEYVRLPWPCPRRSGSIPAEVMKKWVNGMLDSGLDRLQTVELPGSRYSATKYERTDIDLGFSVQRTEKSCMLDMWGATTKAAYADDKGRY